MIKIIFLITIFLTSCGATPKLETLCRFDFDTQTCWKNKDKGQGYESKDIHGWYVVSPQELELIVKKLIDCN